MTFAGVGGTQWCAWSAAAKQPFIGQVDLGTESFHKAHASSCAAVADLQVKVVGRASRLGETVGRWVGDAGVID